MTDEQINIDPKDEQKHQVIFSCFLVRGSAEEGRGDRQKTNPTLNSGYKRLNAIVLTSK